MEEKTQKTDIASLSPAECTVFLEELGEKPFRGRQVFSWLHEKRVTSFAEMTDLSAALRQKLVERCSLPSFETVRHLVSALDGTEKFAFRLSDGNVIESVLMRYRHGNSVCISSQAGCRMGCVFCASTLGGLARDLTASEMLEQVYEIGRQSGERVSNIVIMGTGEPLDNYDNVLRFLRLMTDPKAGGISQRNITMSTCGLVPQILRLADEKLQITLAISLHAPNDALRRTLLPVAKRYSIGEVMQACDVYFDRTGRRISFEYSLIDGVNDGEAQARELAALIGRRGIHVNLIPVNPIEERSFQRSAGDRVLAFKKCLENCGINVTIRRRLGADIDGACGQLRRSAGAVPEAKENR